MTTHDSEESTGRKRLLEAIQQALMKAIDSAIEVRWEPAKARAASARGATVEERVAEVRKTFSRELATWGRPVEARRPFP